MLLRIQSMYGLGEVEAVVNCWAIEDFNTKVIWDYQFGILPPSFIDFNLKFLTSNL